MTIPTTTTPVMEMRNISKRFDATQALDNVSLQLYPGEVQAVIGENGAGKSTLIKIMTGVYRPDAGDILLDGRAAQIRNSQEAQALGVAAIYQEPMIYPDLNVAENIFISHADRGPIVRWGKMYADAEEILGKLGVRLDVRMPARGLTLAAQQAVEIAKAISLKVRVLIMDEPTASLSEHEVTQLFILVRSLCSQGVAVLFIGHRLEEVFRIADRITVLRDGKWISSRLRAEATSENVIRDMVGRDVSEFFAKGKSQRGDLLISVRNLGKEDAFQGVTFDVYRGEVLGFAGLIGSRRTDVGLALFGIEPADTGEILVEGKAHKIRSPGEAMRLGIAYASEDRRQFGLSMPMSIAANISLPVLSDYLSPMGLVRQGKEIATAERFRERLAIRTPSVLAEAARLSGGNQQKVMLSKWLNVNPKLLILDEPTRGIDVGAKVEVHQMINDLAKQGIAVIMISSDLPEVLGMSDRVMVMREGRQMAIFDRAEATEESVMAAAMGQAQQSGGQVGRGRPEDAGGARMKTLVSRFRPEQIRLLFLLVLMALVVVFFSIQIPGYFNTRFIIRESTSVVVVAILAIAQTLVFLTRNFDLSLGSIIGVTAYIVGQQLWRHPEIPPAGAVLMALGLGMLMGSINGVLIAYGRVPSIITTIATLAIYRSFLVEYSNAVPITTNNLPRWLVKLSATSLFSIGEFDVRVTFAVMVFVILLFQLVLSSYPSAGACLPSAQTRTWRASRIPCQTHRFSRLPAERRAGGPRGVPLPGPIRQHHGAGRHRPGI